jgi:hypothetical protein
MSTAASIALILLIVEALIASVFIFAIFAGMIFLMIRLRMWLKIALPKAQGYTSQINSTTHGVSDKVVSPFMAIHATSAHVRTSARSVRRRLSNLL